MSVSSVSSMSLGGTPSSSKVANETERKLVASGTPTLGYEHLPIILKTEDNDLSKSLGITIEVAQTYKKVLAIVLRRLTKVPQLTVANLTERVLENRRLYLLNRTLYKAINTPSCFDIQTRILIQERLELFPRMLRNLVKTDPKTAPTIINELLNRISWNYHQFSPERQHSFVYTIETLSTIFEGIKKFIHTSPDDHGNFSLRAVKAILNNLGVTGCSVCKFSFLPKALENFGQTKLKSHSLIVNSPSSHHTTPIYIQRGDSHFEVLITDYLGLEGGHAKKIAEAILVMVPSATVYICGVKRQTIQQRELSILSIHDVLTYRDHAQTLLEIAKKSASPLQDGIFTFDTLPAVWQRPTQLKCLKEIEAKIRSEKIPSLTKPTQKTLGEHLNRHTITVPSVKKGKGNKSQHVSEKINSFAEKGFQFYGRQLVFKIIKHDIANVSKELNDRGEQENKSKYSLLGPANDLNIHWKEISYLQPRKNKPPKRVNAALVRLDEKVSNSFHIVTNRTELLRTFVARIKGDIDVNKKIYQLFGLIFFFPGSRTAEIDGFLMSTVVRFALSHKLIIKVKPPIQDYEFFLRMGLVSPAPLNYSNVLIPCTKALKGTLTPEENESLTLQLARNQLQLNGMTLCDENIQVIRKNITKDDFQAYVIKLAKKLIAEVNLIQKFGVINSPKLVTEEMEKITDESLLSELEKLPSQVNNTPCIINTLLRAKIAKRTPLLDKTLLQSDLVLPAHQSIEEWEIQFKERSQLFQRIEKFVREYQAAS